MHNLVLGFLNVPIKIMIMHNLILGFLSAPIKIIIIDISVKERYFLGSV